MCLPIGPKVSHYITFRLFTKSSKVLLTNVVLCLYRSHTLSQSTWCLYHNHVVKRIYFYTQMFFLEIADYFPYCVTCHSARAVSCVVSGWQRVRERLCVFVVPSGGEKQVASRLKYWWVMINSCGWWKSEAHLNRRRVFWSRVLMPSCGKLTLSSREAMNCILVHVSWNLRTLHHYCSNSDVLTGCMFPLQHHINWQNAHTQFCHTEPSGCHNKGVVASVLNTMHCSQ